MPHPTPPGSPAPDATVAQRLAEFKLVQWRAGTLQAQMAAKRKRGLDVRPERTDLDQLFARLNALLKLGLT